MACSMIFQSKCKMLLSGIIISAVNGDSMKKITKNLFMLALFFLQTGAWALNLENGKIQLLIEKTGISIACFQKGNAQNIAELKLKDLEITDVNKIDNQSVKLLCSRQTDLILTIYEQSPYFEIAWNSPDAAVSVLSLFFQAEAVIIPDPYIDNYVFFPARQKEKEGFIFPGFHTAAFLLTGGNAMLACSWLEAERISCGKLKTDDSCFNYYTIMIKGKNKLQIGLPAAEGLWQKIQRKPETIEFEKQAWKAPFSASWQINYFQKNEFPHALFTDESYPVPQYDQSVKSIRLYSGISIQKPDIWQGYEQANGRFPYPVYLQGNDFYIRKMNYAKQSIIFDQDYPQVVYALDAPAGSEGETLLPLPIRKKILSGEMISNMAIINIYQGSGICSGTEKIEKIFKSGEQKAKQQEIESILEKMNIYQEHVHSRAREYLDWEVKISDWLGKNMNKNPGLIPVCQELKIVLDDIQDVWKTNSLIFKTPKDFAMEISKVNALLSSAESNEKQDEACAELGRILRTMGGKQHHTIGMFRKIMRAGRFLAVHSLLKTNDPALAELLSEFLAQGAPLLRYKHGEEGK